MESVEPDRTGVLTLAVVEAARRLDIQLKDLGEIVGISPSKASRLMRGKCRLSETGKDMDLPALLVRLYASLFALVGGDDRLAQGWLHSPNKAFSSASPIDLIRRISGLVEVCDYLDAQRARQ